MRDLRPPNPDPNLSFPPTSVVCPVAVLRTLLVARRRESVCLLNTSGRTAVTLAPMSRTTSSYWCADPNLLSRTATTIAAPCSLAGCLGTVFLEEIRQATEGSSQDSSLSDGRFVHSFQRQFQTEQCRTPTAICHQSIGVV